jgi:hypothetical protein
MVGQALAAYERTLIAGGSPFDRSEYGHDAHALSDAAARGLELFRGRAKCVSCHLIGSSSALFTDGQFHLSPGGIPSSVTTHLATAFGPRILRTRSLVSAGGRNPRERAACRKGYDCPRLGQQGEPWSVVLGLRLWRSPAPETCTRWLCIPLRLRRRADSQSADSVPPIDEPSGRLTSCRGRGVTWAADYHIAE